MQLLIYGDLEPSIEGHAVLLGLSHRGFPTQGNCAHTVGYLCRSNPEEKRPGLCPRSRKGPCRTAAQAGAPPLALGLERRITPACARGHLPNGTGAFTCGRREASLRWVISSSRAGLASTEPVFVRHRAHSPLPSALSLTSQEACQPALPRTSRPFSPSGAAPRHCALLNRSLGPEGCAALPLPPPHGPPRGSLLLLPWGF